MVHESMLNNVISVSRYSCEYDKVLNFFSDMEDSRKHRSLLVKV